MTQQIAAACPTMHWLHRNDRFQPGPKGQSDQETLKSMTLPLSGVLVIALKRRAETDRWVGAVFAAHTAQAMTAKLTAADIAFARVNGPAELANHPQLRRIVVEAPSGPVRYPAPAGRIMGETRDYGAVPALGADTEKVRAEFLGTSR